MIESVGELNMISFGEARAIVMEHARRLPATEVPLAEALGRILAEPLCSKVDSPVFANSAVDGYGVRLDDVAEACAEEPVKLKIGGEVRAGQDPQGVAVRVGNAIRLLTGA